VLFLDCVSTSVIKKVLYFFYYYIGVSVQIRKLNYLTLLNVVKERVDGLIQKRGPQFETLSDLCCKSYVCGKYGHLNLPKTGLPSPRFNIVQAPVVDGEPYFFCFLKMSRDEEWVLSDKIPTTSAASFSVLEELVEPLYLW
jgi:hypothetical protein